MYLKTVMGQSLNNNKKAQKKKKNSFCHFISSQQTHTGSFHTDDLIH